MNLCNVVMYLFVIATRFFRGPKGLFILLNPALIVTNLFLIESLLSWSL